MNLAPLLLLWFVLRSSSSSSSNPTTATVQAADGSHHNVKRTTTNGAVYEPTSSDTRNHFARGAQVTIGGRLYAWQSPGGGFANGAFLARNA